MDLTRMRQLAGFEVLTESGVPSDSNLHPAGTGKKATTGSAGSAPAAKVPSDSNLHPAGTGKKATTGSAGSAPAAKIPSDTNLHPAGTGKRMASEAQELTDAIIAKVTALGKSLSEEAEVKFADYRYDALKRIDELVSKYVD